MTRKTAIIMGAMKAGTTTLHGILAQHPEICGGWRKELNFFREDPTNMSDPYSDQFPQFDASQHRFQLDSSPNYTKLPKMDGVPERIAEHARQEPVQLIYILRDPVARLRSHVYHNFRKGRWQPETLTKAQIDFCINVSRYHMQLEAFAHAGLEDRILLVDFQRLITMPESVAVEIHAFLGLDPVPPKNTNARHVNSKPKTEDHMIDLDRCRDALQDQGELLKKHYDFVPQTPWTYDP
ncbi:MAG: sulfotransferase [Pseudomonadota bacterium]